MEVSLLSVARKNLNASLQKKNEQTELLNLHRVFAWCVACRLRQCRRLSAQMCSDIGRMDKKGDQKIDAEELAQIMKFLGWVGMHPNQPGL